jgi:prepilin-type N-terminal cleavage/methylation domain-containing protein
VNRRAFTLVEVTIVVALIGVMAVAVLPRFAALQSGQATRDFASALLRIGTDARLIAIESGQTVQVRYDDERRVLVFESLDLETLAASEQKAVPLPALVTLSAFTLDGAFTSEADWNLQFYPDGSGLDAGVEVEDGSYVYHVNIEGRDGAAVRGLDRLEESSEQEWQAGELEQRI